MREIAVIGAGAAGLMAAIHAAGPGRRVRLYEATSDGGRKILISGGGRCNVLPSVLEPRDYVTASSANTMRNMLRSWPLTDQQRFFEEEVGLPLVLEPETGKLFPVANKARAVRDSLLHLAERRGVEFVPDTKLVDLVSEAGRWKLIFAQAAPTTADAVILATGGLSVPQTGSDGAGLSLLARLGHTVHPTYPALTPLTLEPARFTDLAGVSLTVTITATSGTEKRIATGGFLFTHRGFSGPAALDVSHVAVRGRLAGDTPAKLLVHWGTRTQEQWEFSLAPGAQSVANAVRQWLPARLADRLLDDAGVPGSTVLAQLTRSARLKVLDALLRYPLPWTSDEGYKKAEVTGGGVALNEVQPRTLESRHCPGLFLAGELLDAFGPIGGYNFVWAWTTGRLAGLGAAQPEVAVPIP
ncbi:MAG: aminoacetone oxidase family FAD-binding enzyme [Gemmatimonadales bacterium]